MREQQIHKVKSWTNLYNVARLGLKTHDVRLKTELDYQVNDLLILQEYDIQKEDYTGRVLITQITYITSNENPCAFSDFCLNEDFCIISFKILGETGGTYE